ncbi:DUF3073 domain-containing protein [Streptomyces sp. G5(2025)]|uniref:DUF3073 domain-containing protein n=1 Tax=Streptomyces sp. G5(2025) TaxID=3406628 RepID=UPI003C2898AB
MGRGRARAKQAKVARELKYSSSVTDFEALQRELADQSTAPREEFESTPEASGLRSADHSHREE